MSLQPARWNFVIWKGATFEENMTLLQGGQGSAGRDLSGYTGELIVRDEPEGTPLVTLDTNNGGIILDSDGNIQLNISDEDTTTIAWQTGVYDLTITSPGGTTDALLFGNFVVRGV